VTKAGQPCRDTGRPDGQPARDPPSCRTATSPTTSLTQTPPREIQPPRGRHRPFLEAGKLCRDTGRPDSRRSRDPPSYRTATSPTSSLTHTPPPRAPAIAWTAPSLSTRPGWDSLELRPKSGLRSSRGPTPSHTRPPNWISPAPGPTPCSTLAGLSPAPRPGSCPPKAPAGAASPTHRRAGFE
jgi:hypothetical protein